MIGPLKAKIRARLEEQENGPESKDLGSAERKPNQPSHMTVFIQAEPN